MNEKGRAEREEAGWGGVRGGEGKKGGNNRKRVCYPGVDVTACHGERELHRH